MRRLIVGAALLAALALLTAPTASAQMGGFGAPPFGGGPGGFGVPGMPGGFGMPGGPGGFRAGAQASSATSRRSARTARATGCW